MAAITRQYIAGFDYSGLESGRGAALTDQSTVVIDKALYCLCTIISVLRTMLLSVRYTHHHDAPS